MINFIGNFNDIKFSLNFIIKFLLNFNDKFYKLWC